MPIVARRLDLFGDAALAGSRELLRNGRKQAPAVGFDRQNIVAATLAHRRRKGTVAMQRVGGNDATFEGQKLEHFQSTRRLVAASRFLLGHSHAGIHRKDVDHVQRRGSATAFVGAAQGLAVDCHHPGEFDPIGLGKGRHETTKCLLEGFRVEQTEHPAEGVVARDAMLQAEKPSQQFLLGLPELGHVRATVRAAQHCRQRNDQYLHQIVPRIVGPRVPQPTKNLLEFAHPTPSTMRESLSESILRTKAIGSSNPYAIPLGSAGRLSSGTMR